MPCGAAGCSFRDLSFPSPEPKPSGVHISLVCDLLFLAVTENYCKLMSTPFKSGDQDSVSNDLIMDTQQATSQDAVVRGWCCLSLSQDKFHVAGSIQPALHHVGSLCEPHIPVGVLQLTGTTHLSGMKWP